MMMMIMIEIIMILITRIHIDIQTMDKQFSFSNKIIDKSRVNLKFMTNLGSTLRHSKRYIYVHIFVNIMYKSVII